MKRVTRIVLFLSIILCTGMVSAQNEANNAVVRFVTESTVLAPIHTTLSQDSIQILFQILFAHQYELSLAFLLILIMWTIVWLQGSRVVEAMGIVNNLLSFLMGALVAIILAQARIFYLIASTVSNLFFNQDNVVFKTFIAVMAIWVIGFFFVLLKITENIARQKAKERKKNEFSQELKEVKALTRGIRG